MASGKMESMNEEYVQDGKKAYVHTIKTPVKDEKGNIAGILGIFWDITERKKAEESVRASEQRYRSYIEVTGQLGWITNASGEVEEDIPAWRRFTGQSYEEAKGCGWTKALHPDDLEHTTQVWKKAVAAKSPYEVEYRIRRYDGIYRYFLARGVPVLEEDGSIREWIGTCIDITERKKTELALRESEEKFRSIFEGGADGIVYLDEYGKILDINKKAIEVFGGSAKELLGKRFTKIGIFSHKDTLALTRNLASILRRKKAIFEVDIKNKNGQMTSLECSTSLLKMGDQTMIVAILRDVSERKKMESTQRESEEKFKSLFLRSPEAMAYLDSRYQILDVNPHFTELFGYTSEEARGKDLDSLIVPTDKIEEAEELNKRAVEGYVYHDTARMRKGGFLIPVSISAAPIFIEGTLTGYIGVYKDISRLKKVEVELRETMRKLQMTNEKLRVVGSLTRHDVRNKLSVITGNAYLARKELTSDSRIYDYLKEIETTVQQVVRIFDFAKACEMLGAQEFTYLNVEEAVDEAVSLLPGLGSVKLINECHGLSVLADSLLRELFYNLIDNSLKHGQKTTTIRIRYETCKNELRLLYEDNGVGVAAAEKPKLFKEGYSTGGSTGYGLYLIKKMMEVYGWTIQETGEPGKGARFIITVPEKNLLGKENYRSTQHLRNRKEMRLET
jgi:PAS domain S-box-containing protein